MAKAKATAAKGRKPSCPKGCSLGEYKGTTMLSYDDGSDRPPNHGPAKAEAVVMLANAGITGGDLTNVLSKLGIWQLKKVDPDLLVKGCTFLVAHVEAQKKAAA